jgi:hypothetical protein
MMRWLIAVAMIGACGSRSKPEAPPGDAPVVATPVAAEPAVVTAPDIVGFWTGDWGRLVLREQGGEIQGVYSHDQGTLTGTLEAGVFRGWWCEVPSRAAPRDAGDVEFRFARTGGGLDLDGRWKYGSEGDWREDWDLAHSSEPPPEALVSRFDDASAFCRR